MEEFFLYFDADSYYWLFSATAQSFAALLALIWYAFIRYQDFQYSEIKFHEEQFENLKNFLQVPLLSILADDMAFEAQIKNRREHFKNEKERQINALIEHRTRRKNIIEERPKSLRKMKWITSLHALSILLSLGLLFFSPRIATSWLYFKVSVLIVILSLIIVSLAFDVSLIFLSLRTIKNNHD